MLIKIVRKSFNMLLSICRATSCLWLIRVLELRLTAPFLDYAENEEVGEVAARARRYSPLDCSEPLDGRLQRPKDCGRLQSL